MRNYFKIGSYIFFLLITSLATAQTSSSGWIYNPMLNNAAAVGLDGKVELNYSYYQYDIKYYGIGYHNLFAQVPINGNNNIGLLYTKRIEYLHLDGYQIFYSHKIPVGNASLSIGVNGGLQSRLAGYKQIFENGRINPLIDPIFEVSDRKSKILGTGIWLKNESWFIGVSTPNWVNNQSYKRTFYGIAGYQFKLNSYLILQPSIDWNSADFGHSINFSTNLVFKESFYLGGAVNDLGEYSILGQATFWKVIRIGYARRFEKVTLPYKSSSAELFLGIRFNRFKDPDD